MVLLSSINQFWVKVIYEAIMEYVISPIWVFHTYELIFSLFWVSKLYILTILSRYL